MVISVTLAEKADYRSYYLLQDRGPDMTPPYSETSQREEQTDTQTDRQEVRGTTQGSHRAQVRKVELRMEDQQQAPWWTVIG